MPKVSIIVPVYNTEKYLSVCLDCLINQTLFDLEIICVNDCSTDGSLAILQKYASHDNRIKIINFSENKGVSVARNTGIENATGEYIGFVDSDDLVDKEFFEKLYISAKDNDADICRAEIMREETNGNKTTSNFNQNIIKYNDKLFFYVDFTTAIYRLEFLNKNKILFPETRRIAEDLIFLNNAVLKCNKVCTAQDIYYHYIRRSDSVTMSEVSFEDNVSRCEAMVQIIKNVKNSQYGNSSGAGAVIAFCFTQLISAIYCLKTDKNLNFCVDQIIGIYPTIKDNISTNAQISMTYPLILSLLDKNDKNEISRFFMEHATLNQMLAANMRYRMFAKK